MRVKKVLQAHEKKAEIELYDRTLKMYQL